MAKKKKSKKNRREKLSPNLQPEHVPGSESPAPKKPKRKNAPARTEPDRMLPSSQDKDSLSPKGNSKDREQNNHSKPHGSIEYLQFKASPAPTKDAPPTLLFTLIENFLTGYGFNSTSRIFQIELDTKMKLDGWDVNLDQKISSNYSDLVKIFGQYNEEYLQGVHVEETSSSSSENSEDDRSSISEPFAKLNKVAIEEQVDTEDTSSSGDSDNTSEDSESDTDAEMQVTSSVLGAANEKETYANGSSNDSTSSDSTSESGHDERGLFSDKIKIKDLVEPSTFSDTVVDEKKASGTSSRNDARALVSQMSTLKSEESSSSDGDSEDDEHKLRMNKQTTHTAASLYTETSSNDSSSAAESSSVEDEIPLHPIKTSGATSEMSSSDSTSDSEPDATDRVEPIPSIAGNDKPKGRNGSSSSETIQAAPIQRNPGANPSLSSTAITSDASTNHSMPQSSTAKRKRTPSEPGLGQDTANKKHHGSFEPIHKNAPFQRVPKDTPIDERFSNKYKSYDYADQAHHDLSVTKGRGFTKEKNKKKRGSYRGGPIDISGGRGIKFDD